MTRMRYPQTTPTVFSGAKAFVEQHGVTVWCELCDTVMPDRWFHVKTTAKQLDCTSITVSRNVTCRQCSRRSSPTLKSGPTPTSTARRCRSMDCG